jgi:Ca-activated chloride channel family protein
VSFGAPYLLVGLLLVPLAAIGYGVFERRRATRSVAWSRPALLPNMVRRPSRRPRYVPVAMFLIGLTFLLVGFARPERTVDSVHTGAAAVVLTFDVSGSMAANDVRPTRILAARDVALRLLRELPSNYQVGLVTFADRVHLVVPPTFDRKSVIANLPTAVTSLSGTAIGDALNLAVAATVGAVGKSAPGYPHPPGAVVLISDGAQTDIGPQPQDAAQTALVDGVPVDTIAVGTSSGIVVQPITLNNGQTSTQTLPVPVDPSSLQQVSALTGGTFFSSPSGARLAKIYESLGSHTSHERTTHELSVAAAGVAFVFMVAGIALSGLWFSRIA